VYLFEIEPNVMVPKYYKIIEFELKI